MADRETREPGDWTKTPQDSLKHFLSLPYEEQTALAYVADWLRKATEKRAEELYQELKAQYEVKKDDDDATAP